MKRLILVRHGKSDWSAGAEDFKRPLNARGIKDSPNVAKYINEKYGPPNLLLSSSANRAVSTARLMCENLKLNVQDILESDDLYHARPRAILSEIGKINSDIKVLAVFGHNPGISQLASVLSGSNVSFKTCCAMILDFEVESWEHLVADSGLKIEYISPKALS